MIAKITVIIATVGRAATARRTVELLGRQTLQPHRIIAVGAQESDIAGVGEANSLCEGIVTAKGLCRQRNAGLDALPTDTDIVVFFDDDFLPAPHYLAEVAGIFADDPAVAGITGDLLADGIHTGGFDFEQAAALLSAPAAPRSLRPRQSLYGCNMAIRLSAIGDMRFDENLPFYGWQEDTDFTYRLGRRGALVSSPSVTGVHMGVQSGRISGLRLGYSQVANIVYLHRKGTIQPALGRKLLFQNVSSNVVRGIWPEPHIDRRGRLKGNLLAFADLLRGRIDPRRIERL